MVSLTVEHIKESFPQKGRFSNGLLWQGSRQSFMQETNQVSQKERQRPSLFPVPQIYLLHIKNYLRGPHHTARTLLSLSSRDIDLRGCFLQSPYFSTSQALFSILSVRYLLRCNKSSQSAPSRTRSLSSHSCQSDPLIHIEGDRFFVSKTAAAVAGQFLASSHYLGHSENSQSWSWHLLMMIAAVLRPVLGAIWPFSHHCSIDMSPFCN